MRKKIPITTTGLLMYLFKRLFGRFCFVMTSTTKQVLQERTYNLEKLTLFEESTDGLWTHFWVKTKGLHYCLPLGFSSHEEGGRRLLSKFYN